MIRYLLDTNICVYIIKKKPGQVLARLQRLRIPDVGISSITLSELEYGVSKSARKEQNKIALIEFVAPLEVLPYDQRAAERYGDVRTHLETVGQPIGSLDTLIAAHALSLGCTLVTNDVAEFNRVPGLTIENWTA